jgi:hypothetical protein
MPAVRRLAAIVAADVVGYWRRMGVDEKGMNPAARSIAASSSNAS